MKREQNKNHSLPLTLSGNKANEPYKLIVIGASLGGLKAIQIICDSLKDSFSIPLALVLHRAEQEKSSLVELMQKHARLQVVEPEDKTLIEPGTLYIAPRGYHLLVDDYRLLLSIDEPVHYARPSIDVLFESAGFAIKNKLIGILLTGSGKDGIWGLTRIQNYGGYTIIQDPKTAECARLPEGGLNSMSPKKILPIEEVGAHLNSLCKRQGEKANRR